MGEGLGRSDCHSTQVQQDAHFTQKCTYICRHVSNVGMLVMYVCMLVMSCMYLRTYGCLVLISEACVLFNNKNNIFPFPVGKLKLVKSSLMYAVHTYVHMYMYHQ